jgi:histidine ammonia-lyase
VGAGAAGEITHLAHAFGPLAGIGQVLGPDGTIWPARKVLRSRGIGEFSLGPKEGIALIQGVPGATGLCVLRLGETAGLDAPDATPRLAIRDDGIGGADPARGSGLTGLRDRIETFGGTFDVTSPAGGGTTLLIEIPV